MAQSFIQYYVSSEKWHKFNEYFITFVIKTITSVEINIESGIMFFTINILEFLLYIILDHSSLAEINSKDFWMIKI